MIADLDFQGSAKRNPFVKKGLLRLLEILGSGQLRARSSSRLPYAMVKPSLRPISTICEGDGGDEAFWGSAVDRGGIMQLYGCKTRSQLVANIFFGWVCWRQGRGPACG